MTRTTKLLIASLATAAIVAGPAPLARAQSLTYTKGQNVAPAFEGWEQDPDGSKWFVFGYMNRNWVEELDIPPGPDNSILPGGPDVGQPTHFLPRRNRFVFRVAAPKGFTEKDELIWTITAHGVTEKAWATLRPDYMLDGIVKASETGALGAGTSSPEVRSNVPPTVAVQGPKQLTARVGEVLTLTAVVKDDGIPKPPQNGLALLFGGGGTARGAGPGATPGAAGAPAAAPPPAIPPGFAAILSGNATPEQLSQAAESFGLSVNQLQQLIAARRNPEMQPPARLTVGKVTGLHLSWFVYRGAGKVTFEPEQVKPWEDTRANMNSPWAPNWTPPMMPAEGKVVVKATFSEPGTYILRGLADDGALTGSDSVTVTVTRGAASTSAAPAAPTATASAAASAAADANATGSWNILLTVGGNQLPITASLKQDGDKVSGTFASPLGEMPVSGTMTGRALKLAFTAQTPQGALPVAMTGDLAPEGTFAGKASIGPLGEADWTATRAN